MSYKCALLGRKLGHSFSPLIHNFIYQQNNIEANYTLIECEPEEVKSVMDKLRTGEYFAYNVTIPYKQTVMPFCDEISLEAQKIGAVNTLYMRDGKIIGGNTDYFGFINELKQYGIQVQGKKAIVLGCGGAAKALVHGLQDMGASVTIAIRKEDKPISTWFNDVVYFEDLTNMEFDLLVNATPVGMYPNMDQMPVDEAIIKKASFTFDVIYNPLETLLMRNSKKALNGLPMLVLQAMAADELFFNQTIDNFDEVYEYVLKEVLR